MQLTHLQLGIQNPEKTIPFYVDKLGMRLVNTIEDEYITSYFLQFDNGNTQLELIHDKKNKNGKEYNQKRTHNYWKFSLFCDDIERVFKCLTDENHFIGDAYQFGDIGYLMHLMDPENHQIEFIQKTFKQNTPKVEPDVVYPLLESLVMGLVTIRSKDPIKTIHFYEAFF